MGEQTPALYVYGVVRAGSMKTLPDDGVGGGTVELIEADGLAAMVTRLEHGTLRVRRRDLDRHLRVLQQAFDETTVVACAFGSVVASEDAIRAHVLDGRREELLEDLRRLEGRIQLNVKASYDQDQVLREIVAGHPEIAALSERVRGSGPGGYYDNIKLGELIAAALGARRSSDTQRVLERLGRNAEAVVVDEADDLLVLKGSFLISRERRKGFDAAVEELAEQEAPVMRFEVVGPLPPTAFVTLEAA